MTLGGAAQVAAAHCPNERTSDPAVCSYNRPTDENTRQRNRKNAFDQKQDLSNGTRDMYDRKPMHNHNGAVCIRPTS